MKATLITTADSGLYANFLKLNMTVISEKLKDFDIDMSMGEALCGGESGYASVLKRVIPSTDILFIAVQENPSIYAELSRILSSGLGLELTKNPDALEAVSVCAIARKETIALEHISDFATMPKSGIFLKNIIGYVQGYILYSKRQLIVVLPIRPMDTLSLLSEELVGHIEKLSQRLLKEPLLENPNKIEPKAEEKVSTLPPVELELQIQNTQHTQHTQQAEDTDAKKAKAAQNQSFLTIKAAELGEQAVGELLSPILHLKNPLVSYIYKAGDYTINLAAHTDEAATAKDHLNQGVTMICALLGSSVYALHECSFAEVVGELLKAHSLTLATAEHGTSGCFTEAIFEYSKIDRILKDSSVFVGNERLRALCIPSSLVGKYGLISRQVATAMAFSAMTRADTSLGISLLMGNSDTKSRKRCHIALCNRNRVWVKSLVGGRENEGELQDISVMYGMNMLRKFCGSYDSYDSSMPGGEPLEDILKMAVLKGLGSDR